MSVAVPLYFDPETEAAITAVMKELAERGVAPYMHETGIRPHITLSIYRDLPRDACHRILSDLAASQPPLPVTFSHLGIFTHPDPVVFLAPTISPALFDLHARVDALLDAIGDLPAPYYLPGNWVPHCTLAVEMPAERIPAAVAIAQKLPLPLSGLLTDVCMLEFPPLRHVFTLPLHAPKEENNADPAQ